MNIESSIFTAFREEISLKTGAFDHYALLIESQ